MTATNTTAPQAPSAGLLGQAISCAISAAQDITPGLLRRPTPCQAWDLDMLLRHANESLATLREGISTAAISLFPAAQADMTGDPARDFRDQARRFLRAWAANGHSFKRCRTRDHRTGGSQAGTACTCPSAGMAADICRDRPALWPASVAPQHGRVP